MLRVAGRQVNRLVSYLGLQIVRKPATASSWSVLEGALHGLLSTKQCLNVVQIGANDGKWNDPLHRFLIEQRHRTNVLFSEPQPEIAEILEETYRAHPSIRVFVGVVSPAREELLLYRIWPQLWDKTFMPYLNEAPSYRAPSGFASTDRSHVERHVRSLRWRSNRKPLTSSEAIEALPVRTATMPDLLEDFPDFDPIDLLQIDVEGTDAQLVFAALDADIFPLIINVEIGHLVAGQVDALQSKLKSHGYQFTNTGMDLLAVRSKGSDFGLGD